MVALRIDSSRLARLVLTTALVLTTVARGSTGEALVLHRHGVRRAHLHVLSYLDLSQNVGFLRLPRGAQEPGEASPAVSGIEVLAVIMTGGAALAVDQCGGETAVFPYDPACLDVADSGCIATGLGLLSFERFPTVHTASASILLRNHSLLL